MDAIASAESDGHAPRGMALVIAASSAGTIFEWYDFFIYGTLSTLIGKAFFPSDNAVLQTLLVWAGFAVGFGFRPLGAVLFGWLGDRLGRKYTFLITVTLMGIATAGVGLIPSSATIGLVAPALVVLMRIAQGLALGGEYGGAAVYVAEHAPPGRRGYFTSFIQASVVGGFVLSIIVVLVARASMAPDDFTTWGWRLPFLMSLALLAISLWMRLKLSESPVFAALRRDGRVARNPFVESFRHPGNKRRIVVALLGVAAGLTVIWYTAMFSALGFLTGPMHIDDTVAELIVGTASALGMGFFVLFGRISDRIGRKPPIVWGYALTLVALFPCFWVIGWGAGTAPGARTDRPVVLIGDHCRFNPVASAQPSPCAAVIEQLSRLGVRYQVVHATVAPQLVVPGGEPVAVDASSVEGALTRAGYDFAHRVPTVRGIAAIMAALLVLAALSGATYGPVAALLSEMFPPAIRYSSMSIPYHIGTGYFGGFLPLISSYVVARTGNPYAGLWYCWVVVLMALVVALWGLERGPPPAEMP